MLSKGICQISQISHEHHEYTSGISIFTHLKKHPRDKCLHDSAVEKGCKKLQGQGVVLHQLDGFLIEGGSIYIKMMYQREDRFRRF